MSDYYCFKCSHQVFIAPEAEHLATKVETARFVCEDCADSLKGERLGPVLILDSE